MLLLYTILLALMLLLLLPFLSFCEMVLLHENRYAKIKLLTQGPTLCYICLRRWYFQMETMLIIKIESHPCYPTNFDWFSWGWSKKHKIWNWWTQNPLIYHFLFWNIFLQIWNKWHKGHGCDSTYMVARLVLVIKMHLLLLFASDFKFLKENWKKAYLIQIRTRSKNKMKYFW